VGRAIHVHVIRSISGFCARGIEIPAFLTSAPGRNRKVESQRRASCIAIFAIYSRHSSDAPNATQYGGWRAFGLCASQHTNSLSISLPCTLNPHLCLYARGAWFDSIADSAYVRVACACFLAHIGLLGDCINCFTFALATWPRFQSQWQLRFWKLDACPSNCTDSSPCGSGPLMHACLQCAVLRGDCPYSLTSVRLYRQQSFVWL